MSRFYGDYSMRGVIFDSMVSTTVTMPALVLLGVMALYWVHRRYYPANPPQEGSYAFLAALLPVVIMIVLWPSGVVSSGKATTVFCTYAIYYLAGLVIFAVCRQMQEEARARAFRFFCLALSAAVVIGMLLAFRVARDLLSFVGLLAVVWAVVFVVAKILSHASIFGPGWTWAPPPTPAPDAAAAEAPEPRPEPLRAPAISLQKLLVGGLSILGIIWLCAYAAALKPFYAVLVLFWVGVAGYALAQKPGEGVSPSPSPPSQDIG